MAIRFASTSISYVADVFSSWKPVCLSFVDLQPRWRRRRVYGLSVWLLEDRHKRYRPNGGETICSTPTAISVFPVIGDIDNHDTLTTIPTLSSIGSLLASCSNHSCKTRRFWAKGMGQTDRRTDTLAARNAPPWMYFYETVWRWPFLKEMTNLRVQIPKSQLWLWLVYVYTAGVFWRSCYMKSFRAYLLILHHNVYDFIWATYKKCLHLIISNFYSTFKCFCSNLLSKCK